jgi:T-complex protein 1 subunit eta
VVAVTDTNTTQGTDQSQGRGQILSNISACLAVQETIKSTLGPYGGDLLLVDENGRQTITNDGATVMKVLPSFSELCNPY